mmetsp:Transcript_27039/g.39964  ORF Transcript_27039/g.39964 Transcript_27039/m.39964 type:complete len:214 (-) Transcript_27039:101-742(-)
MMKRPSLVMMDSSSTCSSDDELGSSLKRVRISTSPGELRLDRDLSQLPEWQSHSQKCRRVCRFFGRWNFVLDRTEPLGLVLTVKESQWMLRISISISRMYPHQAPKIAHVNYQSTASDHHVSDSNLHRALTAQNHECWWTPIKTLSDFLQDLLERLAVVLPPSTQSDEGDDYCRMEHDGGESHLPRKVNLGFPPNRFDIGYDRSINNGRAMEC